MNRNKAPLILFYNRVWEAWPDTNDLDCAHPCEFTSDRGRLADADAVVFHVPTIRDIEWPVKAPGQVWVAWSMESGVNYPVLDDRVFMARFDITMTHRRGATIWMPYFGPPTAAALLTPPRPKTESSPAVLLQSSPFNRSGRIEYAAALMTRVKVDSYGAILRNRSDRVVGVSRAHGNPLGGVLKLELISRYKFTLVFENSIEPDYVSDKFFEALAAGSVPVYLGAPNVGDFAPAPRSYIDVADFKGPADLAAYLNHLDSHDTEYEKYLDWKRNGLSRDFLALVAQTWRQPLCRLSALVGTTLQTASGDARMS